MRHELQTYLGQKIKLHVLMNNYFSHRWNLSSFEMTTV